MGGSCHSYSGLLHFGVLDFQGLYTTFRRVPSPRRSLVQTADAIGVGDDFMQAETKTRWEELCALAETETDADEFLALHREIVQMLKTKQDRLERDASKKGSGSQLSSQQ
jgi:hypothetical protein